MTQSQSLFWWHIQTYILMYMPYNNKRLDMALTFSILCLFRKRLLMHCRLLFLRNFEKLLSFRVNCFFGMNIEMFSKTYRNLGSVFILNKLPRYLKLQLTHLKGKAEGIFYTAKLTVHFTILQIQFVDKRFPEYIWFTGYYWLHKFGNRWSSAYNNIYIKWI